MLVYRVTQTPEAEGGLLLSAVRFLRTVPVPGVVLGTAGTDTQSTHRSGWDPTLEGSVVGPVRAETMCKEAVLILESTLESRGRELLKILMPGSSPLRVLFIWSWV